jgi:deazaflavin-dependent oxidoreductase (nitroreductase family)
MPLSGEFEPSPTKWVQDQVDRIDASGGTAGTTMRGMPVVVLTVRGAKTGKLRKVPLMRVEHDGVYAVVASIGGAPKNPLWYYNLRADPKVEIQDGTLHRDAVAREVTGAEKAIWWERAVAAFPDYAAYQQRTTRQIPVFVLE